MEKRCKCHHHKVAPLLLVVLGLVLLWGSLGGLTLQQVSISFSVVVILTGLVKFIGGMCKCYNEKHW